VSTFKEFLRARLEAGGFTTEDTLVSFLPLMRQVIEAHAAGCCAPLRTLDGLSVDNARIWFHESARVAPKDNAPAVRQLDPAGTGAVEVVGEQKRSFDVTEGTVDVRDLRIGDLDADVTKPVYLPGYVAWEHAADHHDPLTDVFSLGIILASLACGLDFTCPEDLRQFVSNRDNLFRIQPGLHPVLAKAIVRMTELSRHKRLQDLGAVLRSLENYRDQEVDFDYDLQRVEGFGQKDRAGKQEIILAKLQERLFEISRRNRLLHFRTTTNTVNLTQASVPLSFDVRNIRVDQLLTWGPTLRKHLLSDKPFCLNRYLNFGEVHYLAPILDRIRTEALRDRAEYGFAQLRLAVCFLRWSNLKASPPEQYDSPLVLVPMELTRKKGVRDTYWLRRQSDEAEINPVLRHQFRQLYSIDLPETIDLSTRTLDDLHKLLVSQVHATDTTITIQKVARPRIDLLHDQARRRLDLYRRRARLAGRGVRRYMDFDYSYDAANFQPLGLQLFSARIRPPVTQLQAIVEDNPRPRTYVVPKTNAPVARKERQFYSLRDGTTDNPRHWEFDLCRVTLGNFRYRKMTLVKDYAQLLASPRQSEAFDAAFSMSSEPAEEVADAAPPLAERHQVVPADPTQAAAVAHARTGRSYIIQGPPGTGKSQTIVNLIADCVARGKRVLFVCEKRAAIDVVYLRLKQQGLDTLCCLIHDSQADKKAFVMDLKQTSESFLAESQGGRRGWQRRRRRLLREIDKELEPIDQYNRAVCATSDMPGIPVKDLLRRAVQLQDHTPELSPLQLERLPVYRVWAENLDAVGRFVEVLGDIQDDGVFANHPLRLLHSRISRIDRPLTWLTAHVEEAEALLDSTMQVLSQSGVPADLWDTYDRSAELVDFAAAVEPIAAAGLYGLLDPRSEISQRIKPLCAEYAARQAELAEATEKTAHWRQTLPPDDLANALSQARAFQGGLLSFLKPSWWRLRKILNACYDFKAHVVRPGWVQVLEGLRDRYAAAEAVDAAARRLRDEGGLPEDVGAFLQRVREQRERAETLPDPLRAWHEHVLADGDRQHVMADLARSRQDLLALREHSDAFLGRYRDRPFEQLTDDLMLIGESLDELPDFLHVLSQLAHLPEELAAAFRELPCDAAALEAAILDRTVTEVLRAESAIRRFDGGVCRRQVARLDMLYDRWQEVNALAVRENVHRRYREHASLCTLADAQLTDEQRGSKKAYGKGRRELEHEFGKQMRYKPIRDLVAGASGAVIRDLKPVWLMSPLSVSDTLPLEADSFDTVIFDEASQITLEEAVPSLFRARQAVVVGDEMQLPPTDFFSAKSADEDDRLRFDEEGDTVEYDLACNSFLNHSARNLSARMLGWHYRSRSEALIGFSNWAFYAGRLLTVPDERLQDRRREELLVASAEDADRIGPELLRRPVSFHFHQNGCYERRRNRAEADYIAHLVRSLIRQTPHRSIGIVAFSEAQQDEIERALDRLAGQDPAFREQLDAEYEREEDDQFVGLLVKNLENIQGDERDVVLMSVCYGYNAEGKMYMNFGPINQSGGEKRLNVAFSRAKHHMALVSSIRHGDIRNEYNDGARCLKNYLRYAAACSVGDLPAVRGVLHELAAFRDDSAPATTQANPLVDGLARRLRQRGYRVDLDVGLSHFRCDLAVRREGDEQYRLGILVDSDRHYAQTDLLERDLLRPKLLRAFGWRLTCILAQDWYRDREGALACIERLLDDRPDVEATALEDRSVYKEYIDSLLAADVLPGEAADTAPVGDAPPPKGADSPGAKRPGRSRPPAGAPPPSGEKSAGGELAENTPRYFEYVGGSSRKFWEVTLSDNRYSVRFGRIGTSGQERTKSFPTPAQARRAAQAVLRSKVAKGYREKPRPG